MNECNLPGGSAQGQRICQRSGCPWVFEGNRVLQSPQSVLQASACLRYRQAWMTFQGAFDDSKWTEFCSIFLTIIGS
jgi:hypothetical protein